MMDSGVGYLFVSGRVGLFLILCLVVTGQLLYERVCVQVVVIVVVIIVIGVRGIVIVPIFVVLEEHKLNFKK